MASVNGVSSSNSSSLYGSRNVFTGLATGMDTESMIQNAISGYQTKISRLQQQQTKLTWQQEDYRSLSDSLVQFAQKYTSYTSSTNLLSTSFFNQAVTTTSNGTYKDMVTASGKSSSEVKVLGVKQLATNARYSTTFGGGDATAAAGNAAINAGEPLQLFGTSEVSALKGTMTLRYSTSEIQLNFDDKVYADIESFVDDINTKLAEYEDDGKARIKATLSDGKITFTDNQGAGNSVSLTGATGDLADTLGITGAVGSTLDVSGVTPDDMSNTVDTAGLISGRTISVTVDGKTKKIELPTYEANGITGEEFASQLDASLKKAFGSNISASVDGDGKLSITGDKGSNISIEAGAALGAALGFNGSKATSYTDVSASIARLMEASGIAMNDADGNPLSEYTLTINDTEFTFSSDTTLEAAINEINASDAGVNITFSKTTNSFLFAAKDTGSVGRVEIGAKNADGSDNLAAKLFGTTEYVDEDGNAQSAYIGEDAVLSMEVNGVIYKDMTRSDNNFSVDGLTLNLKGTFGYTEDATGGSTLESTTANAVTFTTTADADTLVEAIKGMVTDLNNILNSVHSAYSTLPATKSNGDGYEPLTSDDEADMTESAIKKYEEKARQGILFGDRDLSSLYDQLRSAITPSGADRGVLTAMGLTTAYSEGVTTLKLDETALRTALANNPDSVRDAFTSTTTGMMTKLNSTLKTYASTTGATKGILIEKAGSASAPLSLLDNDMLDQINNLDTQIRKWQTKMSNQVDYYTTQFTRLEMLTSQLNSQSSLLSGMMGGG